MVDQRERALSAVASARDGLHRQRRREGIARARLEAAVVSAVRAGVSQRAIAVNAGVSQPYVSQVVAATRGRFVPSSPLGYVLAAHRREVLGVAGRYWAGNVTVFGSVATGEDGPESDVDLLVDVPEDMGLLTLSRMEQEIAEVLGVPVDVVPARLLKAEVHATAERAAVPL